MAMKMLIRFALIVLLAVAAVEANKFRKLLDSKLVELTAWAKAQLGDRPMKAPADYPYWSFMPQYSASIFPTGKTVEWSSPCFQVNQGHASYSTDGKMVDIKITSSKPVAQEGSCSDSYMTITSGALITRTKIETSKINPIITTSIQLLLPADLTESEKWDIDTKGIRMMRYVHDEVETISGLLQTLELFIPEFTSSPPLHIAEANRDFLNKYASDTIITRDTSQNIVPTESDVHSGDAFYLMRLDGLNPLLAWAMGSTTGHVTTALWIGDILYVCESTTDSAYWPTDYIQKTPFTTWIQQTTAAGFQVIWAPLNEQARKSYNSTAALEFYTANEGYNYGFQTMIWAWLDTPSGNFPCLPPDYSSNCMQWQLLEPFIAYIDRLIPEIGDMIWNPGMAKRLNTNDGLRTADYYMLAGKSGILTTDIIKMPEQDTWLYNTTRYDQPAVGRSMVCCVLVCSMWKAAGVFGDLAEMINCAEATNYDDYALTVHGPAYRQIVGSYSLDLPGYNTVTPYEHMHESCAALPPTYARESGC